MHLPGGQTLGFIYGLFAGALNSLVWIARSGQTGGFIKNLLVSSTVANAGQVP
jgi:hypothetical protein